MGQRSHERPFIILFWGTESIFSTTVLRTVLATHKIHSIYLPGPGRQSEVILPLKPQSLGEHEFALVTTNVPEVPQQIAWQANISAYGISALAQPAVYNFFRAVNPDIVCVACFPWRIPKPLLPIPRYGFLNLHPSLLPTYRGPVPLFWQLRAGLTRSGITLHQMTPAFDQGPIVAQQEIDLIEGADGATLDRHFAQVGGDLLAAVLTEIDRRGVVWSMPQPSGQSTQSWPQAADFALEWDWSARHAFNFMRGTAEWHQPYLLSTTTEQYRLRQALGYDGDGVLPQQVVHRPEGVAIQLNPGVLYASLQ